MTQFKLPSMANVKANLKTAIKANYAQKVAKLNRKRDKETQACEEHVTEHYAQYGAVLENIDRISAMIESQAGQPGDDNASWQWETLLEPLAMFSNKVVAVADKKSFKEDDGNYALKVKLTFFFKGDVYEFHIRLYAGYDYIKPLLKDPMQALELDSESALEKFVRTKANPTC